MISMELIDKKEKKRLYIRVDEMTKIGELKRFLRKNFGINNSSILMQETHQNVTDDMTIIEAGFYTGSGVIIKNEMHKC